MSSLSVVITTYLCPLPWKAAGIYYDEPEPPTERRSTDGGLEVIFRLVPQEWDIESEVLVVNSYLVREQSSVVSCVLCRNRQKKTITSRVVQTVVQLVNSLRMAGHPECVGGCPPVRIDAALTKAAYLAVQRRMSCLPNASPSSILESEGALAPLGGVDVQQIQKPWGTKGGVGLTEADCGRLVEVWAQAERLRGLIFSPAVTRIGVYFQYSLETQEWFAALALASGDVQEDEYQFWYGEMSEPCGVSCVSKLQYFRRKLIDNLRGEDVYEDTIVFRWKIPPELCNIVEIQLIGDVRGLRLVETCDSLSGRFCRGEIPLQKDQFPFFAGREMEFDMRDIEPFPGEFFWLVARLDGVSEHACNPLVLAANYFSHFCHTSGQVMALRWYDRINDRLHESNVGCMPEAWKDGNQRLVVNVEGSPIEVIPSDMRTFCVGDRVVLHKGGVRTVQGYYGDFQLSGCQDPDKAPVGTLLNYRVVKRPHHEDRVEAVPIRFWGLGQ